MDMKTKEEWERALGARIAALAEAGVKVQVAWSDVTVSVSEPDWAEDLEEIPDGAPCFASAAMHALDRAVAEVARQIRPDLLRLLDTARVLGLTEPEPSPEPSPEPEPPHLAAFRALDEYADRAARDHQDHVEEWQRGMARAVSQARHDLRDVRTLAAAERLTRVMQPIIGYDVAVRISWCLDTICASLGTDGVSDPWWTP